MQQLRLPKAMWMWRRGALLAAATGLILASSDRGEAGMALVLMSPKFIEKGEIPADYTCEGKDVSPPLAWSGAPPSTKSFALIVDDPDAPDPRAPKRTWVHWVIYNLPADAKALAEGAKGPALPAGSHEGTNDWKKVGYGGPCPPVGRHRYFFKLFALDTTLSDLGAATKQDLEKAMQGHVVAKTELVGTYEKKRSQ